MEAYERLKHLRKDLLKMTQQSFSARIHLSRSNLSNIEKGRITLTDRVVFDVCREFSVSQQWLLEGVEPVFTDRDEDAVIEEIAGIYKSLNDTNRKYLAGYIARLLEEQKENPH